MALTAVRHAFQSQKEMTQMHSAPFLLSIFPSILYDSIRIDSMKPLHILSAMTAAAVTAFILGVVMMAAMDIGIIVQISGQKRLNRCVRLAFGAAIESDARIGQRDLRTAANPAADQGIYSPLHQESCQRTVAAALCSHYFRANHASSATS